MDFFTSARATATDETRRSQRTIGSFASCLCPSSPWQKPRGLRGHGVESRAEDTESKNSPLSLCSRTCEASSLCSRRPCKVSPRPASPQDRRNFLRRLHRFPQSVDKTDHSARGVL